MKQKDLKRYSNDELREIMLNIKSNGINDIEALPLELQSYVKTEQPVGNEMTRVRRIYKLAGEEVVKRFLCKELIETNTVAWFEKRIAELQTEYDGYCLLTKGDDNSEKEEIIKVTTLKMINIGGKLKGYKEGLAYLISHNVE
jgi:hypothetical protein